MATFIDDKGYERGKVEHSNLVHRQKAYNNIYLKNRDDYPLPFSKYQVHHIDFNKRNNNINNLQIVTPEEHEKLHGIINIEKLTNSGYYNPKSDFYNINYKNRPVDEKNVLLKWDRRLINIYSKIDLSFKMCFTYILFILVIWIMLGSLTLLFGSNINTNIVSDIYLYYSISFILLILMISSFYNKNVLIITSIIMIGGIFWVYNHLSILLVFILTFTFLSAIRIARLIEYIERKNKD